MARDFSGTTEYLLTTSTPVTALPLSISCWFEPDEATANDAIISIAKAASTNDYVRLWIHGTLAGRPLTFQSQTGGSFGTECQSSTVITNGTLYHGGAMYTSSSSYSVIVNGSVEATVNPSIAAPTNLDRIGIGVQASSALSLQFDGRVSEVGIWNVALSTEDWAALGDGFSPRLVRPDALVFCAPLVRDVIAVKGPLLTATGTSVFAHPRILMPRRRGIVTAPVVGGGGGGFQAAWARGSNVILQPGIS